MEKKYYFIIAAIVIVGALIYLLNSQVISPPQQDEQMAVKCGNKTVFRYKYPSKIFPVIINDYATNFNIVSGVLNRLASDSSGNSSVSTEAKNNARQLRDTLDQDNIFFENSLKAYFLASNDDPCNDSLRYMYTAYIKEMTEKVIQLKQFVAQVSTPAGNTSAAAPPEDSVLAVVDTAKGKIDTISKNIAENKIVIKKDYGKLSSAISQFQNNYNTVELKKLPSTFKVNK
ncbi:MAG: hypothetical protein ABI184_10045 [Ginsengibacter sp.]